MTDIKVTRKGGLTFQKYHTAKDSEARAGLIQTDHGPIETPIFMPVGTVGSVKGVHLHEIKEEIGLRVLDYKLLNIYSGPEHHNIYPNGDEVSCIDIVYYCQFIEGNKISKRRDIICFDFEELVDRVIMLSPDERYKFQKIKDAMRKRLIAFNSIECYYLLEEIYFNL